MKMTLQQFNITSISNQENESMTSNFIYGQMNACEERSYHSSSSMGMVADIGSLSIGPSYGASETSSSGQSYNCRSSEKDGRVGLCFRHLQNWTTSLENQNHPNNGVNDEKEPVSSDVYGENTAKEGYKYNHLNENSVGAKEPDSGPSELYSRGHWRRAEDSKLKELVATHGPQN